MLYKYRRLHLSLVRARFAVGRANGEIFVAFFFICRRPIVVSIGLVDDHPLMIEGIITLFSRAQGLEISSTGSTARDIIDISSRFRPDVIIVDLSMSGDVYEAIASSIKVSPNTKIVAFTAATGVDSAIRALDAGANGYVLKGSSAQELIQAVEAVRHGETYITQSFASQVIAALRNASLRRVAAEAVRFSIREDQIVRLLLRGKTNKEIAFALKISEKTVKNYMTILMQKLNARNRLEVVIAAQALTERELESADQTSQSQRRQLS
jgi:DNA-binding NarL/FixJ family response regulator